jgi:hypothetical protein
MTSHMSRWHSFVLLLATASLMMAVVPSYGRRVLADANTSPACSGLQVALSSDKNYYIFTATVTGDASTVAGYTFNFGDHQSYHVSFDSSSSQDRHTATATHVYLKNGMYQASAYFTTALGKHSAVGGCHANVTVGDVASTLPNTGAGSVAIVFGLAAVSAAALHQVWLRRHQLASREL